MRSNRISSGQSLVEFALVFPLILLLLMGLFDIGRAVLYYATLNTAVREGTRFAIVQSDCDYKSNPGSCTGSYLDSYPLNCSAAASTANINICAEIVKNFFNLGNLSSSTITINHTNINDLKIIIGIDYVFTPITPGIALMGNITMHANSQMLMTPIAVP